MKTRKILGIFIMLCALTIIYKPVSAEAASAQQKLWQCENGWQRIDDTNSNILYDGTWQISTDSSFWGDTDKYSSVVGDTIEFKFYGTKLRIITQLWKYASNNTQISIDGVTEYYSEYKETTDSTNNARYSAYEKTGLNPEIHTVIITVTNVNITRIDAIDIDQDGYLISNTQSTILTAVSGTNKVDLSWISVAGATDYKIYKSNIQGVKGELVDLPYTLSDSLVLCTDNMLDNGITYYYIVAPIFNGVEGPDSNEVSVTPTAAPSSAVLSIYLDNGIIKEYNLNGTEIEDFLAWYDNRSNEIGKAYYTFVVNGTVTPYRNIKNYIPYNKILYFDVKSYD